MTSAAVDQTNPVKRGDNASPSRVVREEDEMWG
jgi:hypothetical protein